MQEHDKLNLCVKFILCNTKNEKYLSDRFAVDSRRIKKNQTFISLHSEFFQNLKNIQDAIKKGASAFITSHPINRKDINSCIPYLIIKDLDYLFIKLLKYDYHKEYNLKPCIIGITGTNGKTSTTLFLAQALKAQDKKIGIISSEGIGVYPCLLKNDYTTPPIDIIYRSLLRFRSQGCHYIIIECSSQGLHQGRIKGITLDYALITNIDKDHIDYHKSLKNYIKSKLKIINQSINSILNYDSKYLKVIDENNFKSSNIFYISKNKVNRKRFLELSLKININKLKFINIYSLKMMVAIMMLEKFNRSNITDAIKKLKPLNGRRQIIKTTNKGVFVIDYAHTSKAYSDIFEEFRNDMQISTVFGCGGDRDASKRKIMGGIVDKYSSDIILTEDNSRTESFESIMMDIYSGIKNNFKVKVIKSRKKALMYLFKNSNKNKMNFVLGKGNEDYILENNSRIKHNDIDYLRNIIEKYEN